MSRSYPPHLLAHAEPSASAYHVHCPQCARPVGGACAEEVDLDILAIRCPACGVRGRVLFAAEYVLCFGAYSGRLVSTMRTDAERDYLDYLLQTEASLLNPSAEVQRVRVAILWHLGWLSAERRLVTAGPNLNRLRAELNEWLHAAAAESGEATTSREQQAQQARTARQASWLRQMQAEEERKRGGGPRRQQQFHQYKRPPLPPPPPPLMGTVAYVVEQPAWATVLGLTLPVSPSTVRESYRRLSKANHPDRGGKTTRMQQINEARDEAEKWLTSVSN